MPVQRRAEQLLGVRHGRRHRLVVHVPRHAVRRVVRVLRQTRHFHLPDRLDPHALAAVERGRRRHRRLRTLRQAPHRRRDRRRHAEAHGGGRGRIGQHGQRRRNRERLHEPGQVLARIDHREALEGLSVAPETVLGHGLQPGDEQLVQHIAHDGEALPGLHIAHGGHAGVAGLHDETPHESRAVGEQRQQHRVVQRRGLVEEELGRSGRGSDHVGRIGQHQIEQRVRVHHALHPIFTVIFRGDVQRVGNVRCDVAAHADLRIQLAAELAVAIDGHVHDHFGHRRIESQRPAGLVQQRVHLEPRRRDRVRCGIAVEVLRVAVSVIRGVREHVRDDLLAVLLPFLQHQRLRRLQFDHRRHHIGLADFAPHIAASLLVVHHHRDHSVVRARCLDHQIVRNDIDRVQTTHHFRYGRQRLGARLASEPVVHVVLRDGLQPADHSAARRLALARVVLSQGQDLRERRRSAHRDAR